MSRHATALPAPAPARDEVERLEGRILSLSAAG
jgi:hypothetical protein